MNTCTLFDPQRVGNSLEPMAETEDRYEYLSSSARPEIAAVREFWESAFADYPSEAKPAFADRFRGAEFQEALFELYVFSLLRAEGYRPSVPAAVPHRSAERLPDFAVTDSSSGGQIFVEAFTVNCDPALSHIDGSLAPLKAALDRLQSPFRFSLELLQASTCTLPYGRMSRAISAWLTSENLATLAAEASLSVESCITRVFEDAGWKVEIEAHVTGPLSSPPRQAASGICLWGTGARFLEPTWPLARGLKKKAARYEVEGPLVLAVSPINDGIDHEDIEPALYGPMWASEAWDGTVTMRREGGGLWMNKDRTIRNKGISAVIVCPNIFPATVCSVTPVCYQCPEPRHPLRDLLPRGSQATLHDIHVSYRAGLSGRQYFGLHEYWPRARL